MGQASEDRLYPRRPPGQPKVARAVREEQMLEVAGRVFALRGFQAASMEEIADGAGISKPMVYNYFGSKERLYFAYLERSGARLLDGVTAAARAETTPQRRLWAGTMAFFGYIDDHREGWAVLYRETAAAGGPFADEVRAIWHGLTERTRRTFDQGLADAGLDPDLLGGTEPLAHAFVGAAESLANWWLDHPSESREQIARRLMNFAWMGLGSLLKGDLWVAPG